MDRWMKWMLAAVFLTAPLACGPGDADVDAADDETAMAEGDLSDAEGADDEAPRTVEGGGDLAGWNGRTDEDAPFDDVRVARVDGAWQVDNGPAVVLWQDDMSASGSYTLSGTFHQVSSKGHPHGTGLVFGGTAMDGPDQAYTYFMVMGDGTYLVKTRDGATTSWVLPSGGWTAHDAVNGDDENGMYTNTLAVQVGEAETVFLVNGTEVFRADNSRLHTDGTYGVRMNHNLTIQFSGLEVSGGM